MTNLMTDRFRGRMVRGRVCSDVDKAQELPGRGQAERVHMRRTICKLSQVEVLLVSMLLVDPPPPLECDDTTCRMRLAGLRVTDTLYDVLVQGSLVEIAATGSTTLYWTAGRLPVCLPARSVPQSFSSQNRVHSDGHRISPNVVVLLYHALWQECHTLGPRAQGELRRLQPTHRSGSSCQATEVFPHLRCECCTADNQHGTQDQQNAYHTTEASDILRSGGQLEVEFGRRYAVFHGTTASLRTVREDTLDFFLAEGMRMKLPATPPYNLV
jgi:hypothetical protein